MNNLLKNIYMTIEISKNSYIKYEIDKKKNLVVDRFINTPIPYPFNYGYINNTLSNDGDKLDSILISDYKIIPKSIILCRPIGILIMSDESGKDNKIICVPDYSISKDFNHIYSIKNISKNYLNKILFFFKNYKKMDNNKWSKVLYFKNKLYAEKEILRCLIK